MYTHRASLSGSSSVTNMAAGAMANDNNKANSTPASANATSNNAAATNGSAGGSSNATPTVLPPPSSLALSAASSSLAGAVTQARLLGLALVVSGDFGTRMTFRYPVPTNTREQQKQAGKKAAAPGTNNGKDGATVHGSSSTNSLRPSPSGAHLIPNDSENGPGTGTNSITSSPVLGPTLSSKMLEPSDDENELKLPGGPTMGATSTSSSTLIGDDMYGMSSDEFARLFCPKLALCARILDVSVDGLRFVSFPIRLRYQESKQYQMRARRKRARQRAQKRTKINLKGENKKAETKTNEEDDHEEKKGDSSGSKKSKKPHRSSKASDDDEIDDDDLTDDLDPADDDVTGPDGLIGDEHDLTFFNVVFILSGGVSQELAAMYGHVAAQLARALLHEQTRAHFVSQQAQLLVSIREKYLNAVAKAAAQQASSSLQRGSSSAAPIQPDFHALSHLLLSHSLLANHLHQLYHGLLQQEFERFGYGASGGGIGGPLAMLGLEDTHGLAAHTGRTAGTVIASSNPADGIAAINAALVKLGTQLTQPSGNGQSASSSAAASAAAKNAAARLLQFDRSHTTLLLNNWFPLHFSLSALPLTSSPEELQNSLKLKPYQTMLLTILTPVLLQSLPSDCSPLLRRLIAQSDPRLNFHALSTMLKVPLAHIYRLVTHLYYWNKCVIVDAIVGENMYTLSERACQSGASSTAAGRSRLAAANNLLNSGGSSSRRSISATPAGYKSSVPHANSFTSSSTASTATSSSSSGSKPSRRRSSSVDALPPPPAPSFIPAGLLYEWSQQFSGGALSLLATLARISAPTKDFGGSILPAPRTFTQHMQRIGICANFAAQQANQAANTSTSTPNATTTSASKLRAQLQQDFLAQLIFLLKKQWVVQVHRWFIRIDPDEVDHPQGSGEAGEDYEEDPSEDEEEERRLSIGSISASNSTRSLRGLEEMKATLSPQASDSASGTPPVDDPWVALFERLSPLYFDGRHSASEILWLERESGLTLGHLQHLTTLFPSQLVMVLAPAP